MHIKKYHETLDAYHVIIPANKSIIRMACFLMPERNLFFLVGYENNIKISARRISHSGSNKLVT